LQIENARREGERNGMERMNQIISLCMENVTRHSGKKKEYEGVV